VLDFLQSLILLGGPGLVLGAAVGAVFPKWKALVLFAGLGVIAFLFGLEHLPKGSEDDDDDDPVILLAIAMFTNFGGWILGLVIGTLVVRVRGVLGRPA
jgi:hypothetical protein